MKIKLLIIIAFLVVLNPIKAQSKMCMCSADSGIFFPQYEIGLSSNIMFEYPLSKTIFYCIMFKKHFEKYILNRETRRVSDEVFDESFCEFFIPTEDCSTAAKLTGLGNTRKLSKMESFRGPQQA
jgi:hypothetical protein